MSALKQRVEGLQTQLTEAKRKRDAFDQRVGNLREEKSTLETRNEIPQNRLQEQEDSIEEQQETLRDQFENRANEILQEKAEKFTEQNEENPGQLLGPFMSGWRSLEGGGDLREGSRSAASLSSRSSN